jgi:hypothetical protein
LDPGVAETATSGFETLPLRGIGLFCLELHLQVEFAGVRSIDFSLLRSLFGGECEPWLNLGISGNQCSNMFADRGTVLESVSGATTCQPNILKFRMLVDQEVSVRGVLILANTRLSNWSVRQQRDSLTEQSASGLQSFAGNDSLSGVRIKLGPVCINAELETPVIKIRNAINQIVEINPGREALWPKPIIASRNAEEEDCLTSDVN